jgi:hypothetical protein
LQRGLGAEEGTASCSEAREVTGADIADLTTVEGFGKDCSAPEEAADGGWQTEGFKALGGGKGIGDTGTEVQGGGDGVTGTQLHPDHPKCGRGRQCAARNSELMNSGTVAPKLHLGDVDAQQLTPLQVGCDQLLGIPPAGSDEGHVVGEAD